MTRWALAYVSVLALVAVPACRESDAAPARERGAERTPLRDAGPNHEGLKPHMKVHFHAVKEIQSAVVAGDLRQAKRWARWLAEHKTHDALASWAFHIDGMRRAARQLVRAGGFDEASMAAARLGGGCASCHEALTAIVTFEWIEKPSPDEGDVKGRMALHQWAGERLWEGLVGPSHVQWAAGADALVIEPLHPDEITPGREPSKEVKELARRVREIGERAKSATETPERVALYGKLLATCAGCHQLVK